MQSPLHTTTHATVLPQDDDIFYEVVDNAAEPSQQTES